MSTKLRPCIPNFFSKIWVEFQVGTSFSRVETRRDERHFFCYFRSLFFVFSENCEIENREKKAIFAIFTSSEMFEKLRNYRNISKIRKTAISENRENKNFGKKRLTQGLRRNSKRCSFKLKSFFHYEQKPVCGDNFFNVCVKKV